MKTKKTDRAAKIAPTERDACRYRIQRSCANCRNCTRNFNGKGHDAQMIDASCGLHGFSVNLDHGICDDFKSFTRGHAGRVTLPSSGHAGRVTLPSSVASVGASVPLARKTIARKTITRRTK